MIRTKLILCGGQYICPVKKVLIITYYWPPSGGGGVQRWLKFVKYLPLYNWVPVIYTPQNPDFEIRDESLLKDIPEDLKVFKKPIWEPFGIYRQLLGDRASQKQGVVDLESGYLSRISAWIRGNLFIPDPRKFWVKPSVNFLKGLLQTYPVDAVVTTGPPHSMHLIGLKLKRSLNLKWIADFRDPWSDWDVMDLLNLTGRSRRKHQALEKEVAAHADLVLTVSPRLKRKLQATTGIENIEVVNNGYDEEDYVIDENELNEPDSGKFRITHVGLLNEGRNPHHLWQILNALCEENSVFASALEIFLAGPVAPSVLEEVRGFGNLSSCLVFNEYMSHERVASIYKRSGLLLLVVNRTDNAEWIIPAKLYEYVFAGPPILALGKRESDANDILEETSGAFFLSYDDMDSIRNSVVSAFENFKSGKKNTSENQKIMNYSRRNLTGKLSRILDKITA